MPLTRYRVRNEYGLGDPELYKAADRDDPEALLEGVAMAGLVGVLRQLGDLAEFAAEIFHDLHEEVMATAARGHGLMVRVRQLEAEFPSFEKGFLSQTNHALFFSNAGVDWHPNLCTEQNLVTRGDLPRFVMDSYEECHGPPRLFLLDKFDVAGAGACLKRYTDPSLFKVEATYFGVATVDVKREKKIRKVKKKGSRWRNGETPEVVPTSHAKLHQWLLEERVDNGHADPARLVKLKRRELNGPPFDLKYGKSYMEKFLETASPEHEVVCEVSVGPPLLKLTSDNSSESGLEILDISTVSPVKKSSKGKESMRTSPTAQEVVLKPRMNEVNGEAVNRGIPKVTDPIGDIEAYESPSNHQNKAIEAELPIDLDGKIGGGLDGDHYDDMTSEVDNYMDALTMMEPEMETDNECKTKNGQGFKHGIDFDANEEQLDVQANFPDSQSIGTSSLSDDGNSSFKIRRSSFSYSDSLTNFAENTTSDGEGAAKVFPSGDNGVAEIVDLPSEHPSTYVENIGSDCHDLVVLNDTQNEEVKFPDPMEASCSSSLADSNPMPLPLVPVANSLVVSLAGPELDKSPSDCSELGSKSLNTDINGANLADSSAVILDVPSLTSRDPLFRVPSESCCLDEMDHEDLKVTSDALMDKSVVSELIPEKKGSGDFMNEVRQTDYADEIQTENVVNSNVGSPHSTILPAEVHLHASALPAVEVDSVVTLTSQSSDVAKAGCLISEVDVGVAVAETGVDLENLTPMVDSETDDFKKHQCSDTTDDAQISLDLAEEGNRQSEESMELKESHRDANDDDMIGLNGQRDVMGLDAVLLGHLSNYLAKPGIQDHVNSNDVAVTELVHAAEVSALAAAESGANDDDIDKFICSSLDIFSLSPPRNLRDMHKSISVSKDSHQKGLDLNEVTPAECLTESGTWKQGQQLEVGPDLDSRPYKSGSVDYSSLEVIKHAQDLPVAKQAQSSPCVSDVTMTPSSKLRSQEWESKPTYYFEEHGECAISPSTCIPEMATSLEQSMDLQAHQISSESFHSVTDEANSKSLKVQTSPTCYLSENGSPSKNSLELQSDQLDGKSLQANEASPKSSNPQSKQIQTVSHIDDKSWIDDLLGQEVLPQSAVQEFNSTQMPMDLFATVIPSFGILPEAAHFNLGEIPPLPPLPPMQWRIGKVQPAPFAQRELIDHSQETMPEILPLSTNEEAQFDLPLSGQIVQPPNPFLSFAVSDSHRVQQLPVESLGNSLQSTPLSLEMLTMDNDSNCQRGSLPLEATQSLNPFLTLEEIPDERPKPGFPALDGETIPSISDLYSPVPTKEHTPTGHDPLPSQGPPIHPLDQLGLENGLEMKFPAPSLQNSEGHGNSPDNNVLAEAMVEEQPQHDLETSQGETWSPNTLTLPPNYEIGKTNRNKLPRRRNPLIDAVAAHDKSKLRKVTEQVRSQIGPIVEERDSLLEQIRTKSFNLKPARVTRPGIQSIQGPKTNLKVAAILEKANAIRQALAGSDEEDDADSWSDS